MENQPKLLNPPPRLTTALIGGFNAVANHVYLILPPIILDVFLWLGPRISLERILSPVIDDMNTTLQQLGSADMTQLMSTSFNLWKQFAEQFNFFSLLRTLPVGIPSLMAGSVDPATPLGGFTRLEVNSTAGMMLIGLVMVIFGLLLGCFYFSAVSRSSNGEKGFIFLRCSAWQAAQTVLLTLLSIALILTLALPGMFVISLVTLISPTLATIALFLVGLLAFWFLIPLVFSPHGIFTRQQNAVTSMLTSVRLVRYLMPSVSLFILVAILLIQGLNQLWSVPPANSWLTLVGIAGHAFIATSMLSASFVFYRSATAWLEENLSHMAQVRI
ncbi:hypothetical protein LARV_01864 [Longilinea arvoryzae]|uniref:Uncharacterized protein n=1 Tax=Longilinea arvoryzae TaxID=360412 RepID=A0A0S7BHY0_9CHLR|nr:hypothetical protein [Longilinea arvoryzae]GAP14102.1 hypothetical protein LARV_01864 [Longilinea arvoryzae]